MKTAVSLPDELFRRAEQLARRLRIPRGQLYARAIDEYVQAHSEESVTAALDEVYAENAGDLDEALTASQAGAVGDEDW
ncbi:MAG: ChpI protein [bacterium]|nr:ChpI protein [bacterium]